MLERAALALGVFVGAACTSAAPSATSATPDACASAAPSYEADVAPILKKHCAGCHSGDGSAAEDHDFSSAPRVHAERQAIARQVAARAMPPRPHPVPSDSELQTLVRFAACANPNHE